MGMLKQAAGAEQPPPEQTVEPEAPAEEMEDDVATDPVPAGDAGIPEPGAAEAPSDPAAGGAEGDTEQATPEEQAEYERAFRALNKVLYVDQKTSEAVFEMLQPDDKVGSISRAGMMVVKLLDDKLDMPETIIAEITKDAVDELVELMQRGKQVQLSEQEQQQAMGATWEGVMELFGQPVEDMRQFAQAEGGAAKEGMGMVQSALSGQDPGAAERRRVPMQGA